MFHLAYIGPISSGATATGDKSNGALGTSAHFDEAPPLAQPKLLLVCQPVALGALGGLLRQLLAALLIPDPLDLGPFFDRHSAPDPTLLGRFPSLRGPAFTLPIRHAFSQEFCLVSFDDVLHPRLTEAFLLILLA
jgi:hypothetical protein